MLKQIEAKPNYQFAVFLFSFSGAGNSMETMGKEMPLSPPLRFHFLVALSVLTRYKRDKTILTAALEPLRPF
jgi:hypothetical protein